jgi:hypothetical protein
VARGLVVNLSSLEKDFRLLAGGQMITKYPRPVEEAMRYTFSTLNERQRRLFAASEALKLGHGGIAYIAQLLDCHRRTIERGLHELRHPDSLVPPHRARKKGVAGKAV